MRAAAVLWLMAVAVAAGYLAYRASTGLAFQTDLMALLPHEERDPAVQRAKDGVTRMFGERVFFLLGDRDRDAARRSGARLAAALEQSGMTRSVTHAIDKDAMREIGSLFFPYRGGLLAPSDRQRLVEGRGEEIVGRALSSIFGPLPIADAALLRRDPFLLMPAWFAELPLPLSRVTADDGVLGLRDGDTTWVFVSAQLAGQALSLDFQQRFVALIDDEERLLRSDAPQLRMLRSGALFYAERGAAIALSESSIIGIVSLVATALLIIGVFRRVTPLLLNGLALVVATIVSFSATIWLFGAIHVAALLFGVSLIGIAVDYSLHYSAAIFGRTTSPRERLRHVLPGIALGAGTTLIGYLTMLLAPFPGLHQLAALSSIGIAAAFLTVVLWLPLVDRSPAPRHGRALLAAADSLWILWEAPRYRSVRRSLLVLLVAACAIGAWQWRIDDDVRRMQALSPDLRRQEAEIQRLTGLDPGGQYMLVQASSQEEVLRLEEKLLPRLAAARAQGALGNFQAVAQYVPSVERQSENRRLVAERLAAPFLATYWRQLGISGQAEPPASGEFLTPSVAAGVGPLSFLSSLIIDQPGQGASHLVVLNGVTRPERLRAIEDELPGLRLIDPTGDISQLLGKYRRRAVLLLAGSAVLMVPLLVFRYGLSSVRVLVPPALAVIVSPLLLAAVGVPFTFFSAIALVLLLSMGVDFAIFSRESAEAERSVTTLGVWLATLSTLFSFGLLALSSAFAVAAFGATMLVGITLAFLFSPLAGR